MGKNKIDLNGRTAVVTGGAQGFGRAITERFVASGAKVAIWDFDQPLAEKTATEIGNAVSAFKVDVSDLAAVEMTRDATLKAFGKIDILVNNAGIAGINKTVWETDLDEWRRANDRPRCAARFEIRLRGMLGAKQFERAVGRCMHDGHEHG